MSRIKHFFTKNEREIILSIGVFFIAVISFQAGWLWKAEEAQKRVIISEFDTYKADLGGIFQEAKVDNTIVPTEKPYVASKNSNKYHKADCSYAKKINEENKIWFASREEAERVGYEIANCCKK